MNNNKIVNIIVSDSSPGNAGDVSITINILVLTDDDNSTLVD